MTTQHFVGPDGHTYSVSEPYEGGFFIYHDCTSWIITFPVQNEPAKHLYFCGDTLPTSERDWRTRELGTPNPFPSFAIRADDNPSPDLSANEERCNVT